MSHVTAPTPPPPTVAVKDKPVPRPATPPPTTPPVDNDPPAPPPPETTDKPERVNPFRPKLNGLMSGKLETSMTEANKAYDRGDLDEARQLAQKILMRQPGNERMLRIMVSSSCMDGDAADAQKYYNQLPPHDRSAMKTRCERYGITFTDPPTQ